MNRQSPGGARIAFVYGDYPPNLPGRGDGGSDFLRHLAETLVARGNDVTAIVSRRDDRTATYTADGGVRVAPIIRDWTLNGARGHRSQLRAVLDEHGVDVVHLIYPDPYLRYRSDSYHLPFLLKRISGRPLVTTLFGFALTRAHMVTRAGLLSIFATSDRLVITDGNLLRKFKRAFPWWSHKARRGLVGGISQGRLWGQPDLAVRKAAVGLQPRPRHVGFFGFWTPDKGLENLIEAIDHLRRRGKDVQLVLIGGGDRTPAQRDEYERGIMRLVEQMGLSGAVIDTGPLSEQKVTEYMLAMDVCALPFKVNPLGRSSLALALNLGVPIIVSRPPEDAQLLEGVALLDSFDPRNIAASIATVLDDPDVQCNTAEAARMASRHWSWESIADQYVAIYDELTQSRRGY